MRGRRDQSSRQWGCVDEAVQGAVRGGAAARDGLTAPSGGPITGEAPAADDCSGMGAYGDGGTNQRNKRAATAGVEKAGADEG